MGQEEFAALLENAGVQTLVDVRSVPGSRRNPQFGRQEMEAWVPATGMTYVWSRELGGFRRTTPQSRNVGLRHASFRGYADYMGTRSFVEARERLLETAARSQTAIMCSETLWFRCHRRLIADSLSLTCLGLVLHLDHRGKLIPHEATDAARLDGGEVSYPGEMR
ncbi:MAG: DUF488 family protein [Candidatus Dormibacteria bacterium]